jgi:hypothetical protein
MNFIFIYENRRMVPVEIVLRRGEGGRSRIREKRNLSKIYYKHMCEYHSISPCTTIKC